MTVKFFAYYRDPDFAGCKEMDWPQEADSVIVLCRQIAERFGDKFRTELLTPDGNGICDRSINSFLGLLLYYQAPITIYL